MVKNFNYYVERNNETKEIIYIEYEKLDGYKMTPKTKKEDAIEVSKIVFVNPSMTEKILKKKIDYKINQLLNQLKVIESDDSGDDSAIRKSLMDAERLKLMIINNYIKYLGHTYQGLTIKKLNIIINKLRMNLYSLRDKEILKNELFLNEEKKGKGR